MNGYAIAYLVSVIIQLLTGIAFLGRYLSQPGWRATAVGRHVVYWVASYLAVDLSWLLLLVAQWRWLVFVLLAAQYLVGLVGLRRVWLVWRPER